MSTQPLPVYPEIAAQVDVLCVKSPWGVTGVSALLRDGDSFLLELAKPRHWVTRDDGRVEIGLGAIGGSLEPGETLLGCLYREAQEELGVEIQVCSSECTYIVHEQERIVTVTPPLRDDPLPALLTVSENLYSRSRLPELETLAIVTFAAEVSGSWQRRDLYGVVRISREQLAVALAEETIPLAELGALPGVEIETAEPAIELAVVRPVWTVRSLQVLLRHGLLR